MKAGELTPSGQPSSMARGVLRSHGSDSVGLIGSECYRDISTIIREGTKQLYNHFIMGVFSDFAAKHWVLGGIAVSLLWFVAGKQSVSNRRSDAAALWQSVAVLIVIIMSGWALAEREWLGLAAGIVVLYLEVRSMRRSTLKIKSQ